MTIEKRFWQKVDKANNNCWIWRGCRSRRQNPYGLLNRGYRKGNVVAHRYSWELHNGKIPHTLYVCHKCDNTLCVNPKHLFLGTQKDNMVDCAKKGRTCHKLNELQVRIIRRVGVGLYQREMAEIFGVCRQQISRIILQTEWRHIS